MILKIQTKLCAVFTTQYKVLQQPANTAIAFYTILYGVKSILLLIFIS